MADKALTGAAVLAAVVVAWAGLRRVRARVRPWPHVLVLTALLAGACVTVPPGSPHAA